MPDDLDQILESPEAQRLATDFVFTEGPVWHPEGHWLFVDVRRSLMFRVSPSGDLETLRENTNGANGLTFDLQGRLILCEGDGRRISRQEPDGSMTTLAETSDGKRLNRPNDLVIRSDGSVYFTNPGGRIAPEDREIDFSGVHRIAPDGSVGRLTGGVLAFGAAGQVASPLLFGALYFPLGYQAAYLAVALPAARVIPWKPERRERIFCLEVSPRPAW